GRENVQLGVEEDRSGRRRSRSRIEAQGCREVRRESNLRGRVAEADRRIADLPECRVKDVQAAGWPIVIVSLPTPSQPHSTWSPGCRAETPAGVPVMMMSPASSETCFESCAMISGTFQIICARSPDWVSLPLTASQIRPFDGWPIFAVGCSAPQG